MTSKVVVLAGPNGAGKSTSAERLLRGVFKVDEFVNADVIAQGLSGFAPERAAMAAGRIMMRRLKELAEAGSSFAFETTLASRTFAPWLRELKGKGYAVHVVFLWLPSEEVAVARVAKRASLGGHSVPAETVRRRYRAGLRNFFNLYQPLADSWQVIDNSQKDSVRLIAIGESDGQLSVQSDMIWRQIEQTVRKLA